MVSPVTSADHLYAIPGVANRVRVVGDWLLGTLVEIARMSSVRVAHRDRGDR
jgi:hypothetical protein